MRLQNELNPEDFEEPYKTKTEIIGTENLIALCKQFGGMSVYITKPDTLLRGAKHAQIRKEFNGYNHAYLARKYNLSDKWIRKICGEGFPKGQMSIYDIHDFED